MSNDLNKVFIIGRLVRDPELKYTQSGTAVANFSVANGRKFQDKEETSFFSVIAWSKLADLVCQYCKKGSQIGIEGRLQQRSWEDKEGKKRSTVEIVADNVQFLGKPSGQSENINDEQGVSDLDKFDDIPF